MEINYKCIGVQTEPEIVKEKARNRDREREKENERKRELAEKSIAKGQKTVIKTKTKNS